MRNYQDAISEFIQFVHSNRLTEAPSNGSCLLAIKALQEKAQQEQGCDYCKDDEMDGDNLE